MAGVGLGALVAASLILSNGALRANDQPVVHVKAVVKDGAVRLEAQANGPFEYTTYRPSESLYVLDLSGVSAGDPAGARVVASDLVKSYRVVNYASGEKPVVRVEILLSQGHRAAPGAQRLAGSRAAGFADDGSVACCRADSDRSRQARGDSDRPPKPCDESKTAWHGVEVDSAGEPRAEWRTRPKSTFWVPAADVSRHSACRIRTDWFSILPARISVHIEKHIASNLDPVREVDLAQFTPEVSRVVIDLRGRAAYNINANGNTVTVSFAADGRSGGAAKTVPVQDHTNLMSAKPIHPAVHRRQNASPAQIPAPAAAAAVALTQSSAAPRKSGACQRRKRPVPYTLQPMLR